MIIWELGYSSPNLGRLFCRVRPVVYDSKASSLERFDNVLGALYKQVIVSKQSLYINLDCSTMSS